MCRTRPSFRQPPSIVERTGTEDRRQSRLLQATASAAQLLLASPLRRDVLHLAAETLALVGRAANAERIAVWRNHFDLEGEDLLTRQIFSWWKNPPEQQPRPQSRSLEVMLPNLYQAFLDGRAFCTETHLLPGRDLAALGLPRGHQLLLAPILVEGSFWGFYYVLRAEKPFLREDELLLTAFAHNLAGLVVWDGLQQELSVTHERLMQLQRELDEARATPSGSAPGAEPPPLLDAQVLRDLLAERGGTGTLRAADLLKAFAMEFPKVAGSLEAQIVTRQCVQAAAQAETWGRRAELLGARRVQHLCARIAKCLHRQENEGALHLVRQLGAATEETLLQLRREYPAPR